MYYNESDFSLQEIERFGLRKERLLDTIASVLDVSYPYRIITKLMRYGRSKAFYYRAETYESRGYILSDNGHEIVHILVHETIGVSENEFLSEGLAEAFQLEQDYSDIIQRFVAYRGEQDSVMGDSTWRMSRSDIVEKLIENGFEDTYYDYLLAGAFTRYLYDRYGIAKVKELYRVSCYARPEVLDKSFTELFHVPIDSVVNRFFDLYF